MRIWLVMLALALALMAGSVTAQESGMRVALDVLATAVENRQPVEATAPIQSGVGELFYFTEVHGGPGSLQHVWIWQGRTMATVPIEVRSSRFRTWSSKRIQPDWTGQWRVEARTTDGKVLSFKEFVVE